MIMKTIQCEVYRLGSDDDGYYLYFPEQSIDSPTFYGQHFRKIAPGLTKGLRRGQVRKCVWTQTARGIKLERVQ